MTSKDLVPDTWAEEGLEVSIRNSIKDWENKKREVVDLFNLRKFEAVMSDIGDITLPEIFAAEICVISGNQHLRDVAATLQAFQTYRVSLYDIRTDKHEYKLGKPTFLKKYGERYVRIVEQRYATVVDFLAKELERLGVANARMLARLQYDKTIEADKKRNGYPIILPSIEETIRINEEVAGNTARLIAQLSNGNVDMENVAASLADSMSTLEDIIGVISREDLSEIKATIPLAYLQEEVGLIRSEMQPRNLVRTTRFVERTREYVTGRLNIARGLLLEYNYPPEGILYKFIRSMDQFISTLHR
jgi:hypothetical protein